MKPQDRSTRRFGRRAGWLCLMALVAVGCKSDLNQQLLERELRYQEDQIYQLQDELQEKCGRLDVVASENASLRKQLGISAADDPAPASRSGRGRSPAVPPAATVPPSISLPDAPAFQPSRATPPGGSGPPATLAPPTLEGVPPLPDEPGRPAAAIDPGESLSLPAPATASIDPDARPIETADDPPALVQMSYEEPVGHGPAARLLVNRSTATVIDVDHDGQSEGIALVVESRDDRERLTPLATDLTVAAFDATALPGSPPLASWTIAAADATARFRPTGRRRGMFLELPWQGTLPSGDVVRLQVTASSPAGPLETEAVIPIR